VSASRQRVGKGAVRHQPSEPGNADLPPVGMPGHHHVEPPERPLRDDVRSVHQPERECLVREPADVRSAVSREVGIVHSGHPQSTERGVQHRARVAQGYPTLVLEPTLEKLDPGLASLDRWAFEAQVFAVALKARDEIVVGAEHVEATIASFQARQGLKRQLDAVIVVDEVAGR
jgi:hypothetical protein